MIMTSSEAGYPFWAMGVANSRLKVNRGLLIPSTLEYEIMAYQDECIFNSGGLQNSLTVQELLNRVTTKLPQCL